MKYLKKGVQACNRSPAVILLCLTILAGFWFMNKETGLLIQDKGLPFGLADTLSILFVPESSLSVVLILLMLVLFGPRLERIFGSLRLILLYSLTGAVGGLFFHFYSEEPVTTISMISMSGLLGVYFRLILKRHYLTGKMDKIMFASFIILLVIVSFGTEAIPGKYALAGFPTGFIMSYIIRPQSFRQLTMVRRRNYWMRSGAALVLIVITTQIFSLFDWATLEKEIPRKLGQWTNDLERSTVQESKARENTEADLQEEQVLFEEQAISPTGSKMYNAILKALTKKKRKVNLTLYSRSSDEVFDTLKDVLEDHPEIYYFDHESSAYWSNGVLQLGYKYSKPEIERLDAQLDAVAANVLGSMDRNQSEYDRVKIVHDYIVKNTAYDYENYLADTVSEDSYSILGTLLKGTAVCDGYAKSMQFLLAKTGIETAYVTGTANGGLHAWNKVKIDNEWYNVDATWDDPVPNRENAVSYDYFLVTDKQLAKDHKWEQADLPVANDKRYMGKQRAVFR